MPTAASASATVRTRTSSMPSHGRRRRRHDGPPEPDAAPPRRAAAGRGPPGAPRRRGRPRRSRPRRRRSAGRRRRWPRRGRRRGRRRARRAARRRRSRRRRPGRRRASPARRSSTASSSASRPPSRPWALRRAGDARRDRHGERLDLDEQRALALHRRHDDRPGHAGAAVGEEQLRRVGHARRGPCPVISNRPSSSVEPKRCLTARSRRRAWWRSPSNDSTVSTTCSSTRGPGQRAVLGDVADEHDRRRPAAWPRRRAAGRTRAPGRPSPATTPSRWSAMVWMLSTTTSAGDVRSMASTTPASDVSAASHRSGPHGPEPLGPQAHLLRRSPRR